MFGSAYTDIIQTVLSVDKYEKREKLKEIILSDNSGGIAVFVKNEMIADFLSSFFSRYHIAQSVAFHGHCVETLDRFRSGRLEVLFTTSDAVLGLDLPNVRHIIHYDMPETINGYFSRLSQTVRVGYPVKITSFFEPEQDAHIANDLKRVLIEANQIVPNFLEPRIVASSSASSEEEEEDGL